MQIAFLSATLAFENRDGKIVQSLTPDSSHARMIVRRESGGSCTAVSPSGLYRGKWQMGSSFWRSFGGLQYASTPDRASCAEQDQVAYRGWLAAWWQPWGG